MSVSLAFSLLRRVHRVALPVLLALLASVPAVAQPPGAYSVEIKLIEAKQKSGKGAEGALDPQLAPLAGDLRALPFESFKLVDSVRKDLGQGESFTVQFGAPERRRFIRATAKGTKNGKVTLDVVMERAAGKKAKPEFRSQVSIPDGGTLVVVAGRDASQAGGVVLLAISARTSGKGGPETTTTGAAVGSPAR